MNQKTRSQINEIKSWIQHGNTLLYKWGLIKKFTPGYTCLFYGPSGTGKTMTATLLGKYSESEVYRIDMAMVVSRYVGDTSKNLGRIFDVARNKSWLLFFDECESCFSKRSDTIKDAHDRWSNQEISYLLQRIDDHPGTVILATNMRQHIDSAFLRRFQNVIEFSIPSKNERLLIWKKGFSKRCVLEKAINLEQMANKYEMAGGAIMNVIRYASLMALERGSNVVLLEDLLRGIQREFIKEGRSR